MKDSDLTRMANQIAENFAAWPEEEAIENTKGHIRSFWDPRMRKQIIDYVANGGADLHPTAKTAIERLREAESAKS